MSKKISIGIIAILIIIAVIVVIFISKSNIKKQELNQSGQQENEAALVAADESIKLMIENLKVTCVDFLVEDLSGDIDANCSRLEEPINKNLCFYCFATKNQTPNLCEKVDSDSALKIICQRATGTVIDEIINQ